METKFDGVARRALLSSPLGTDDFAPASALVRADLAARSHPGVLKSNEDHYLVLRLGRYEETLFTSLASTDVPRRFDEYAFAAVVADGIGRAGAGAMAARLAINTLAHLHLRLGSWSMRVDSLVASEIVDRSQWMYRLTHEAVLAWYQAHADVGRMAATMTGVYSAGTNLFVAHVGHSRCYLFRKGLLTQLTRDQTLRERLAESRQPTSVGQGIEDGEHIVTSAIGADAETPRIIVEQFRLEDDDTLLLCTNGLTDMVTEEEIADTLASRRTPEEQCSLLLDAALTNGGHDNVTVVLANYHIPKPPAPEF
jgi:PPM family protein phosphatase